MEIKSIKEYLDKNFVDVDSVYAAYTLGRLLEMGQMGDKRAKLQVLVALKGLMYNSLKWHMAYLWLPEDDTLQMLSETVLQELNGWDAANPKGFCKHISYCFKNNIRNSVRRSCNHNGRELLLGGTQTEETERLLDTVVWEGFFDRERRYAQKFSVRELLGCLTEKQRYVVAAEIFEDKDDVEIAGMMKISKSAVSRIRTRAIRYLQDILDVRQGKEVPLC